MSIELNNYAKFAWQLSGNELTGAIFCPLCHGIPIFPRLHCLKNRNVRKMLKIFQKNIKTMIKTYFSAGISFTGTPSSVTTYNFAPDPKGPGPQSLIRTTWKKKLKMIKIWWIFDVCWKKLKNLRIFNFWKKLCFLNLIICCTFNFINFEKNCKNIKKISESNKLLMKFQIFWKNQN